VGFRDHPVFVDDDGAGESRDAVILQLGDRLPPAEPAGTTTPAPIEPPVIDEGAAAKTSTRLDRLDAGRWYVCRDLADGGDHLVVGPGGVFTVRSLRLVGHVEVTVDGLLHNGEPTDCHTAVAHHAGRLSSRLSRAVGFPVRVRPVLAVDADGFSPGAAPFEVAVVTAARIHKWLPRQAEWMPAHEAFRIATAARRASTWR
jgi:hypothetical protein